MEDTSLREADTVNIYKQQRFFLKNPTKVIDNSTEKTGRDLNGTLQKVNVKTTKMSEKICNLINHYEITK